MAAQAVYEQARRYREHYTKPHDYIAERSEAKGIVFNELSDCIEIKGSVPWQHPSKYWRDADDAQLLTYLTYHYGKFTRVNYDVALAK